MCYEMALTSKCTQCSIIVIFLLFSFVTFVLVTLFRRSVWDERSQIFQSTIKRFYP